jgi:Tfp pilus assembly protein PilW
MMKCTTNERGFSLLELMVGAMLTVGLVGAIFMLLNRNQQVFISESGTTDMNQNMRTAVDLLTRDVQSAGMGLPNFNKYGTFAALYYINGASSAPDKILVINGDPYAPTADVESRDQANSLFVCKVPPDVTINGSAMTYLGANAVSKSLYKNYTTDAKLYAVYDDNQMMVMQLSQDGAITGSGGSARLQLRYSAGSYTNPPTTFGATIDTGEPSYTSSAKIAMISSLIAYRLNQTTGELERTEDLTNWYAVARGIIDFQIDYRVISGTDGSGNDIVSTTSAPTDRTDIRSVVFTITAETPDLDPKDKNYRKVVQKFEATPRNLNLLNNNNLSPAS